MNLEPDILLCSTAPPETPADVLLIQLCERASTELAKTCWAVCGEGVQLGLPLEITSELPEIALTLEGDADVVERGAEFLKAASAKISVKN